MRSIYIGLCAILFLGCQDPQTASRDKSAPLTKSNPPFEGSGIIKGNDFLPSTVGFTGLGDLCFRQEKGSPVEMTEISITMFGGYKEGDIYEAGRERGGGPIKIRRLDSVGFVGTEMVWSRDYSSKIGITKRTADLVEGTIDLTILKPDKTRLTGMFTATKTDFNKTSKKTLGADDAPYIQGKIVLKGDWEEEKLSTGFIATGAIEGKYSSNCGGTYRRGQNASASTLTFEPQITSMHSDGTDTFRFAHTRLVAGECFVYVRRGEVVAAWQSITVKPDDQHDVQLTIDLSNVGSLVVTLPDEDAIENNSDPQRMLLIPAELVLPEEQLWVFKAGEAKKGDKKITVSSVPAGRYKALLGRSEALVEVIAGKESEVTLVHKE